MYMRIDRASTKPLYQQLVAEIQQRIRSGALPNGSRLPPVREMARDLGVTRLTVHSAYSELQAGGWVEATVGRGTFVAARPEPSASSADLGREFSHAGLISDMLRMTQIPGMRSLAMADAAAELFPTREFARTIEEALAHDSAAMLAYTSAQGEPLLRTVLADLVRERGVHSGPDRLVVTSGVTQGLALVARTLAGPGDAVLVEQPTYVGAINVLSRQNLRLIGVPMDDDGMDVEVLESLILAHRPRFLYTIPTFHNPTGVCLSSARRATLLEIAARHRLPIVEDDIYAPIALDHAAPPALKSSDPADLVIYLSSFSKAALPGSRIGYVVAPAGLLKRLIAAKQADDLCSPTLMQRALALFIEHGHYASHLRRAIPHYRVRRDALLEAMAHYFPSNAHWTTPGGGFAIWVRLPHGMSTTDLYLAAIERGVAFAPGDFFFASPISAPYMRLAYSSHPPDTLREITRILGELLNTHMLRRNYTPANHEVYPLLV